MPGTTTPPRSYIEVDAKAVRCETVRAIRGLVKPLNPMIEPVSHAPRPRVLCSAISVLSDLEQSLAAISHSLAEGVEHATGGKRGSL